MWQILLDNITTTFSNTPIVSLSCIETISSSPELTNIIKDYTEYYKIKIHTLDFNYSRPRSLLKHIYHVPILVEDAGLHNYENFIFIINADSSELLPIESLELIKKRIHLATNINDSLTGRVREVIQILQNIKKFPRPEHSIKLAELTVYTSYITIVHYKLVTCRKIISSLKILVTAVARGQLDIIDSWNIPIYGIDNLILYLSDSWVVNMDIIEYSWICRDEDEPKHKLIEESANWYKIYNVKETPLEHINLKLLPKQKWP